MDLPTKFIVTGGIFMKTITLTGTETSVQFDKKYPYIWVRNHGENDVYMSVKPNIVPDADGVIFIPAGSGASTGDESQTDVLYLLGSGKVEVSPQFNAVCPFFKSAGKGGGESSSEYPDDLKFYFDYRNGVINDMWTDKVSGYSVNINTPSAGDDFISLPKETSLGVSNIYAYTAYIICKCPAAAWDWHSIFSVYGTIPEFNLAIRSYNVFAIGTGTPSGEYTSTIKSSDKYHICALSYFGSCGWLYIDGIKIYNYDGYHYPMNSDLRIGHKINFKAIKVYLDTAHGYDTVLANMQSLIKEFDLDV